MCHWFQRLQSGLPALKVRRDFQVLLDQSARKVHRDLRVQQVQQAPRGSLELRVRKDLRVL